VSELHKFLFDGLPVRGAIVRLTDAWQEILRRRASNSAYGAYPAGVQSLLGEMTAAANLMQSNIKFDGALILQIVGDGPVKLVVTEVQSDFSLRSTATIVGDLAEQASLSQMVNVDHRGRCVITLDPKTKFPGQQAYQGVVPLLDEAGQPLERMSEVLEHYMLQSEQLDTTLVLAADGQIAAGLLIQRLPVQGVDNLAGHALASANEDQIGLNEHYNRISILAKSLKPEELLQWEVDTVLHRLFWQESLTRFAPQPGQSAPRFVCNCSRERVGRMIVNLGHEEAQSILAEHAVIEVGCGFCGVQYRFDPVDAAQLFTDAMPWQTTNPATH
jgi:molecular chaperone Hsp33